MIISSRRDVEEKSKSIHQEYSISSQTITKEKEDPHFSMITPYYRTIKGGRLNEDAEVTEYCCIFRVAETGTYETIKNYTRLRASIDALTITMGRAPPPSFATNCKQTNHRINHKMMAKTFDGYSGRHKSVSSFLNMGLAVLVQSRQRYTLSTSTISETIISSHTDSKHTIKYQ